MTDFDDTRQQTQYLLGQLRDAAAAAFEDRYFQDDELFARLEVAADDLAARYAAGALSADESSRFRTHLLGSSDDRLRLRVSAALAARVRAEPAEPRTSAWRSVMAVFSFQSLSPAVAAAASIVLVAGLGVVSWRLATVQQEMNSLRTALADEQAESRSAVAAASERERRERSQREAAERRIGELATSAFVVVPGSERGASESLLVPASAAFVRLDLALERPLLGRCRVTLRTIERVVVWSQDVDVSAGAASVTVTVPAAMLRSAQYEAVVQSIQPSGTASEVGVYGFKMTRGR